MMKTLFKQEWRELSRNPRLRLLLPLCFILPLFFGYVSLRGASIWLKAQIDAAAEKPDLRYAWVGPSDSMLLYNRMALSLRVSLDTQYTETQALALLDQDSLDGVIVFPQDFAESYGRELQTASLSFLYHPDRKLNREALSYLKEEVESTNQILSEEALKARKLSTQLLVPMKIKEGPRSKEVEENTPSPLRFFTEAMRSSLQWVLSFTWLFLFWLVFSRLAHVRLNPKLDEWMRLTGVNDRQYSLVRALSSSAVFPIMWLLSALGWYTALHLPQDALIQPILLQMQAHWIWSRVLAYLLLWTLTVLWLWQWRMTLGPSWGRYTALVLVLGFLFSLFWFPESSLLRAAIPVAQLFWTGSDFLAGNWGTILLSYGFIGVWLLRQWYDLWRWGSWLWTPLLLFTCLAGL